LESAEKHYGKKVTLERDNDVLDTWFSSGLWPFSTMGWPEKTEELLKYYPTSCLVTGSDIIFFWVARMIMMGLKFMNEVPFKDIYIHGLIRDEKGIKMSKTKGNVIDPLEVINKYGADSLRFSLTAMASQGRDIKLSFPVIEGYRNFMNKIWNASRFVMMNLDNEESYDTTINTDSLKVTDKWILSRLNSTIDEIQTYYSNYEYDKVAQSIYHFIWNEYCDWYIELSKQYLYGDDLEEKRNTLIVLLKVLVDSIKLLHPISPFITEELYQTLRSYKITTTNKESILINNYPEYSENYIFEKEYKEIEYIKDTIVSIRNLRANLGIHPSDRVNIIFNPESSGIKETINKNLEIIYSQANVENIEFLENNELKKTVSSVIPGLEIYLPVEGLIDIDIEIKRLEKDLIKLKSDFNKTSRKLDNKEFLNKAPEDVIEKEKSKFEEYSFQISKIEDVLIKLKKFR
ncbi:MAG: class I tRNA ligase family protein, partial [Thermodesulfobacteriota bacterium]